MESANATPRPLAFPPPPTTPPRPDPPVAQESPLLAAALSYAARGWRVLPLVWLTAGGCCCGKPDCSKPGKHPAGWLVPHGVKDATLDPETVRRWWTRCPEANVGIATGGESGFDVLDVDGEEGATTLMALEREHGLLPSTPESLTGGGGRHVMLAHAPGLRNAVRFAPGLDVRTDGGYIVAPPSVHASGRVYAWEVTGGPEDVSFAPWPEWLAKLVRTSSARARVNGATCNGAAAHVGGAVPEGKRNATLASLAGSMRHRGMDEEAIRAALLVQNAKWFRPPLDETEVESVSASIARYEPARTVGTPVVVVDTDMRRIVDEAEAALREHSQRRVFVRSGRLVVLAREGKPPARALKRPDVLHAHPLGDEALRESLASAARFVHLKQTEDGDVEVPTLPPPWVARALAERGEWNLPLLVGLVHGPTLRSDGTVLATPGYDAASGLFADFLPSAFPPVPENPTRGDAQAALDLLREPFRDFPYVTPADASVDLAAVLSLLGRDAIDGPVPLFALDAPTRGSGKTLRADIVALVATGRTANVSTSASDADEMRKALFAVALEGHSLMLIDNVVGAFGSGVLSAYLTTSGDVRDRRLGVSETAGAPWRAVVLATGNNLVFRGDVGRRALLGTIDPACENAEDRTGWTHDPLREWVRENRPRLYVAGLTLLRAFVVAGVPRHDGAPMGSFEAWDRLVRGALLWAGAADPCGTRARIREDADADLDVLRGVLGAWFAVFTSEALTVADALKRAPARLREALGALAPKRAKDGDLDSTAVGNALRKVRGRVLDGLRLAWAGKRDGSRLYRVERAPDAPAAPLVGGDSGDSGDSIPSYAGAGAPARTCDAVEQAPGVPQPPSHERCEASRP